LLVKSKLLGENLKKGASCIKVKVLSKDGIFHVALLYWLIMHFSHNCVKKSSLPLLQVSSEVSSLCKKVLHSIEVKIEDVDVYMVHFMSIPSSFDNLVMNLESISTKDVGLQFIIARLLHEVSKRNESKSTKNVARLMARGFTKTFGVDYNETFSLVAKFVSIRCVFALATIEDLEIHQMDIKTAFINADLEEDMYMEQPKGFTQRDKHLMYKLHKSLYGLKQSPKAWNQKLDAFLKNIKFVRSDAVFSMYVAQVKGVKFFIIVYVDDLI
jgi:hypothetical protein